MEPRLSLITLGVADLERSLRFYRDGLGWPTSRTAEQGIIFFQTSGVCLALYPYGALAQDAFGPMAADVDPAQKPRFTGITLAHNVRCREEVDRILQQAAQAAQKSKSRPERPFGAATAAIFPIPTAICGKSPGARSKSATTAAWWSRDRSAVHRYGGWCFEAWPGRESHRLDGLQRKRQRHQPVALDQMPPALGVLPHQLTVGMGVLFVKRERELVQKLHSQAGG